MSQISSFKEQKIHIDEGLIGFYSSYREVPWKELLSQANVSLDVVVYYWDKWVAAYEIELVQFLKKPKTKMRIVLADERKPDLLADIWRLFPGQGVAQLKEKIRNTYLPLEEFKNIEVYRFPHLLNYSMQCVDGKILVLSLFEMHRQEQMDSPAIMIDLEKSPNMKQFYQKEMSGLLKTSVS